LKLQTGAEIHYLTKKGFRSIVEVNPHISKVYTIEKRVGEVLPNLRKEKYDYIIDLHHNLRTFLIKWAMPFVKCYSFKKLNFEKWLLVNFKINRLPKVHIVDRYLETVRPLGVVNDGAGLDFFLNEDMSGPPECLWAGFQNLKFLNREFLLPTPSKGGKASVVNSVIRNNYVAFPIGAGLATKALTIEKIINICQSIDYPIVLLGGKQEIEKGKQIELGLENKENTLNLVAKCSLLESAAIVKYATVVLTGDTGLMHIAAAFHRPIVSVWGNTVPEFGMYPYYPKGIDLHTLMEVKGLSCRPCSKIGFGECPKGHFKCIEQLEIHEIIATVNEVFNIYVLNH